MLLGTFTTKLCFVTSYFVVVCDHLLDLITSSCRPLSSSPPFHYPRCTLLYYFFIFFFNFFSFSSPSFLLFFLFLLFLSVVGSCCQSPYVFPLIYRCFFSFFFQSCPSPLAFIIFEFENFICLNFDYLIKSSSV